MGGVEMIRFLKFLSVDLTHACNLNCDFCGKRVSERDGKHMTKQQLGVLLKFAAPHYQTIRISGGEPLVHPHFNSMMRMLLEYFSQINIATNGIALNRVDKDIYDKLNFLVSVYPGVNDDALDASHSNVYPIKVHEYFDPRHDPDLDDGAAKRVYAGCVLSMAKVVGDRVYACCHAETSEHFYSIGKVGVKVGPDWIEELQEVDTWKACKHCFVAHRSYGYNEPT